MKVVGKCYWIVGASEGLGRALAVELNAAGARLVVSARSADRLNELAATLTDAIVLPMDVSSQTSVAAAAEKLPKLDGLIYCAGTYEPMEAAKMRSEVAVAMCETNFVGAFRVLGLTIPGFLRRGSGHVVLIGSLAGYRGLPGAIGYGASKAALMHLADNLRVDLWQSGVKVQVINPGYIRTRLTAKNDFKMPFIMEPEDAARRVHRAMQSGRFQTSFPAPFSWMFRVFRYLPDWLYVRLVGRRPASD